MTPERIPNTRRFPPTPAAFPAQQRHDVKRLYNPATRQSYFDWGHWPFDYYDPPPEKQPASAATPRNA